MFQKPGLPDFRNEIFLAILFLFFLQQLTFLVESIYMLNLLNTEMDIRAAGIALLLLPGILYLVKHKKSVYQDLIVMISICVVLSPFIPSVWRIFTSGIGAGLLLAIFGLMLSDGNFPKMNWSRSLAITVLMSVLFRVAGYSQDASVAGNTKFISWLLLLLCLLIAYRLLHEYPLTIQPNQFPVERSDSSKKSGTRSLIHIIGLMGAIIFIYFVFASPGVLSRWVEGDFAFIHIVFTGSLLITVFLLSGKLSRYKTHKNVLLIWNVLFFAIFVLNILLHRVSFPALGDLSTAVAGHTFLQSSVLYIMLVLSPIVFLNVSFYTKNIPRTSPAKIASPVLIGVLLMILCIFMLIFTNTWGYVGAVSQIFRNQFHVPFLVAGILMILPYFSGIRFEQSIPNLSTSWLSNGMAIILVVTIFGLSFISIKKEIPLKTGSEDRLVLMTYNIQQGVDLYGNKNFEGQLAKIKEINPDILCLQESDATRISGGNSDLVYYFSRKLGYHEYYGPKTIMGTYGTAILSRYPLENAKTMFTYSSKDEIGTAIAEIDFKGKTIKIINSHPAGDEMSREEHIKMVIKESKTSHHVIAMGDYNFRQDSPYYHEIAQDLYDSWLALYPDAVGQIDESLLDLSIKARKTSSGILLGKGQIDMTSRIDHIFLSDTLEVLEAHYLPAPESATDHPLYWCVITFKD